MKKRPLQTLNVPSLQDLLDLDAVPEYPIERGAYEHRTDPIFVLHTSGSTGIPKPLIYTNEFWGRVMNECKIPAPPGYKDVTSYFKTGKFLMTLPGFHVSTRIMTMLFLHWLTHLLDRWSRIPPLHLKLLRKCSNIHPARSSTNNRELPSGARKHRRRLGFRPSRRHRRDRKARRSSRQAFCSSEVSLLHGRRGAKALWRCCRQEGSHLAGARILRNRVVSPDSRNHRLQ